MIKKETEKFASSNVFEGMTSISSLLNCKCDNDRKIIKILYNEKKISSKRREFDFLRHKSEEFGFELETVPLEEIEKYTIGSSHGGVIAFCSDRTLKELTPDCVVDDGFYFMLEGIEDPYNFGYSLRSLYAAGVNGIILPERNWMGAAGVVARASAGASELIDMYTSTPENLISVFRQKKYNIFCADLPNSVSLYSAELKKPLLVIVGGEKRGNSKFILDNSDQIIRIDYGREFGASLSAASASAIIAFEVMRQNIK